MKKKIKIKTWLVSINIYYMICERSKYKNMEKNTIKKFQKVRLLTSMGQLFAGDICYVSKVYDDGFVDLSNKSDSYLPQDDCIPFRPAHRVPINQIELVD